MKHKWPTRAQRAVLDVLLLSSGVSLALLIVRIVVSESWRLSFLWWNLFLAWIPLLLAVWLESLVATKKTPTVKELLVGLVWLFFLPNSFYIITDLIHLQSSGEVSLLYDTALITSFVVNGLLLGFISVYIVHKIILGYVSEHIAYWLIQLALLLSGFAIYLGRYLRWNSWDVVINPMGLLFDVSDRIVNPGSYMLTFVVTLVFYILLGSSYAVIYRLVKILRNGSF